MDEKTTRSPLVDLAEAIRAARIEARDQPLNRRAAQREALNARLGEASAALDLLAEQFVMFLDDRGLVIPVIQRWIADGIMDEEIEGRARALGWEKKGESR